MKVFYFSKSIKRTGGGKFFVNRFYGDFKDLQIENSIDLIQYVNNLLEKKDETQLTHEEIDSIVSEDLPRYDCYAVQKWADGFENGTLTLAIFKTRKEADAFIISECDGDVEVVGQRFGKKYINYWT
jgi:hypothetical protein